MVEINTQESWYYLRMKAIVGKMPDKRLQDMACGCCPQLLEGVWGFYDTNNVPGTALEGGHQSSPRDQRSELIDNLKKRFIVVEIRQARTAAEVTSFEAARWWGLR